MIEMRAESTALPVDENSWQKGKEKNFSLEARESAQKLRDLDGQG
jgi:hypothetical protein